jgi:hypothetical protein
VSEVPALECRPDTVTPPVELGRWQIEAQLREGADEGEVDLGRIDLRAAEILVVGEHVVGRARQAAGCVRRVPGDLGRGRSEAGEVALVDGDDGVAAEAEVVGFGVAVQQGGLERRHWSRDKIGLPVDGEDDLGDVGGRVIDERYAGGDAAGAVDDFLAAVGAQQWRENIEPWIPGAVEQAEREAANFFEVELPVVGGFTFGPEQAAAISAPVLSIVGSLSGPM